MNAWQIGLRTISLRGLHVILPVVSRHPVEHLYLHRLDWTRNNHGCRQQQARQARILFFRSPVFAAEWSVNPKPQPRGW
jgi:hypothetical protein